MQEMKIEGTTTTTATTYVSCITEQMMDVEEIITAGTSQTNSTNNIIFAEMKNKDGNDLLQLKQEMASELVSFLLSVARVPGPSNTVGIKSCAKNCDDILETAINRVSYYITGFTENMVINQLYGTEVKKFHPFMELKDSSLCPHSTLFYFAKLHNLELISILPSMPRTSKWRLPLTFYDIHSDSHLYVYFISLVHATCIVHSVIL